MLITKYTAILLESAKSVEARNSISRPFKADLGIGVDRSSSLESVPNRRRVFRRRHLAYRREIAIPAPWDLNVHRFTERGAPPVATSSSLIELCQYLWFFNGSPDS
ncbi:jg12567 [Pararge aegeria aegeria]|uniref:Jg12567 protein n=1 Tax=Pararge aegeria aegeria TaxID=348720 RepID=A0A8S4SCJ3_9NEOP|nr:jg12567 [Pararge aegeria aegeria]